MMAPERHVTDDEELRDALSAGEVPLDMLRATGPLSALETRTRHAIMGRAGTTSDMVRVRTASIIERVRSGGDGALVMMAREFDKVELAAIEVPRARRRAALDALDPALRSALERTAANIATVHAAFRPTETVVSPEPGITVGRRPDPLGRVGVYAPGGRAAYPSSLLMGAIPARTAGVGEIIVCSPPGPEGEPHAVVMAAAELAQVDRLFALGGAGAIAAMALGTATVPRVDRIVGPGNAYVAEAKLQLVSQVAIDAPAGPSELLVLADHGADPAVIAREMLAQAEHDPDAAVITIIAGAGADGQGLSDRVLGHLRALLAAAVRGDVAGEALAARGAVLLAPSLDVAIDFANEWAAEHLLLLVPAEQEAGVLGRLRNAGTVFIGDCSSVAFGDYMTGANHVLPTAGAARSYSGLSTLDFVRWTTWQRVTPAAAARLADPVGIFADAEGLPAHAAAARAWADTANDPASREATPNR